tara:strand:- start:260 stop:1534 length:1275 start_codon:yes stop_codon:yes gene_type:complete
MSNRLEAFKSLFTGKSFVSGSPSVPNLYNSSNTFHVLNNYFKDIFGSNTNQSKYLKAYGENPLVYMVVNKIANTTASIDLINVDAEGQKLSEAGAVLELLKNPNAKQTEIEFLVDCYVNLLTTGNCYQWNVKGIGAGDELVVIPSNQIELGVSKAGFLLAYKYTNSKGKEFSIPLEEINHIKTNNSVNIQDTEIHLGMSPLQALWVVVQSSSEKFKAEASIFKNRGIVGILTNRSETPMLKKDRDRLQNEFNDEVAGADKFNRIKISNTDLKYIQTGMSPTDLKLLDGIVSSLRLLCAAYGMPSVLFNDNASSTYNNVSEARKTAAIDVYIPLAKKVLKSTTKFLNERLGSDDIVTIDITSIEELKASTNKVLQAINGMPSNVAQQFVGAMTVDELRALGYLESLNNTELVININGQETNNQTN